VTDEKEEDAHHCPVAGGSPEAGRSGPLDSGGTMADLIAAPLNLNHVGHYVTWGVIQISVANLVVIAAMVVVFLLALLLPFPRGRQS
jgi:hypothetical protein